MKSTTILCLLFLSIASSTELPVTKRIVDTERLSNPSMPSDIPIESSFMVRKLLCLWNRDRVGLSIVVHLVSVKMLMSLQVDVLNTGSRQGNVTVISIATGEKKVIAAGDYKQASVSNDGQVIVASAPGAFFVFHQGVLVRSNKRDHADMCRPKRFPWLVCLTCAMRPTSQCTTRTKFFALVFRVLRVSPSIRETPAKWHSNSDNLYPPWLSWLLISNCFLNSINPRPPYNSSTSTGTFVKSWREEWVVMEDHKWSSDIHPKVTDLKIGDHGKNFNWITSKDGFTVATTDGSYLFQYNPLT